MVKCDFRWPGDGAGEQGDQSLVSRYMYDAISTLFLEYKTHDIFRGIAAGVF